MRVYYFCQYLYVFDQLWYYNGFLLDSCELSWKKSSRVHCGSHINEVFILQTHTSKLIFANDTNTKKPPYKNGFSYEEKEIWLTWTICTKIHTRSESTQQPTYIDSILHVCLIICAEDAVIVVQILTVNWMFITSLTCSLPIVLMYN